MPQGSEEGEFCAWQEVSVSQETSLFEIRHNVFLYRFLSTLTESTGACQYVKHAPQDHLKCPLNTSAQILGSGFRSLTSQDAVTLKEKKLILKKHTTLQISPYTDTAKAQQ
jgi:hypothetical protein